PGQRRRSCRCRWGPAPAGRGRRGSAAGTAPGSGWRRYSPVHPGREAGRGKAAARRNRSCAIVAGVGRRRPVQARARRRPAYNARMPLITLQNVDYSVGGPLLLEHADLSIEPGERIALIGRNGAGKSTLLKLIAGELQPDDGQVRVLSGLRVARLEQEVHGVTEGSVFEVVAGGLGELGTWMAQFHQISHAEHFDAKALERVQARIDAADGWALDQRVAEVLRRLELDGDAGFARLSGDMKRRVLLARSLVSAPDVLLLDEPTNHLDIEAIDWLEGFLKEWGGCVVFVTHDRRFLRALATRIVEIDRSQVTSWP